MPMIVSFLPTSTDQQDEGAVHLSGTVAWGTYSDDISMVLNLNDSDEAQNATIKEAVQNYVASCPQANGVAAADVIVKALGAVVTL